MNGLARHCRTTCPVTVSRSPALLMATRMFPSNAMYTEVVWTTICRRAFCVFLGSFRRRAGCSQEKCARGGYDRCRRPAESVSRIGEGRFPNDASPSAAIDGYLCPITILTSQENGGVLVDPAIPARLPLPAEQGHLHGNCIEASFRWTRSRAWREPARSLLRPSGLYEVPINEVPRTQPVRLELRSNQRLYVPFGSPPSVAVGLLIRACRPTEAARSKSLYQDLIDCGESDDFKVAY